MKRKHVSIIVPCYNHAHFLDEAMESVLNQKYTDWECIIVNDGSPDNTEEIALKWCEKDNRFKYLKKDNGGLSSARNAGIKLSKGEYILPLDSDDIIDPEFLEKLVPELKANNLAIVSCYSKFFVGDISNIIHLQKPIGTTYHALMFENIMMATSLYRKSCWEQVGGYDETMKKGFEDWELWVAITKLGWEFKFVEEFLFYYRKSKKSMLTDTLQNHRENNMHYVFTKHKTFYVENYEMLLDYIFFLLKSARMKDKKVMNSLEYKVGILICKPIRWIQKLF